MTDTDKMPLGGSEHEEEYHFSDEEIDKELSELEGGVEDATVSEDLFEPEVKKDSVLARLTAMFSKSPLSLRKILIICVIVIVLIFGLLKFNSQKVQPSFEVPKATPVQLTKTPVPQENKKAAVPTVSATQPAEKLDTPVVAAASKAADDTSSIKIPSIAEQRNQPVATQAPKFQTTSASGYQSTQAPAEMSGAHVATLQKENKALSNQVTTLTGKMATLNANIEAVSQQLQSLNSKVNTMNEEKASKEVRSPQGQLGPQQAQKERSYRIEAVVPGRAWVETPNGQTVTVTVGDTLHDFGTVIQINPYSGSIVTSSGTTIGYDK